MPALQDHVMPDAHELPAVTVVSDSIGETATVALAPEHGAFATFTITGGQNPVQILPRNPRRYKAVIWSVAEGTGTGTNPTPSQPSVPATGVAQQNVNSYPVQVVISANGATITNVSVNGITVGTAAGTYVVPAYGSISIAYSVATPTWVWSDANPLPSTVNTENVWVGSQAQVSGPNKAGAQLPTAGLRIEVESQQEYFAAPNDSTTTNTATIIVADYWYDPVRVSNALEGQTSQAKAISAAAGD